MWNVHGSFMRKTLTEIKMLTPHGQPQPWTQCTLMFTAPRGRDRWLGWAWVQPPLAWTAGDCLSPAGVMSEQRRLRKQGKGCQVPGPSKDSGAGRQRQDAWSDAGSREVRWPRTEGLAAQGWDRSRSNLGVLREENWRGNSTSLDGPQVSVWSGAGVGGAL